MLVTDRHWGEWVAEMTRHHFRCYIRPWIIATEDRCDCVGCLMPAGLSCREYPVQPGDTVEVPARGEHVGVEPIFFHPLPALHNPHAFLVEVRRMRNRRARVDKL